MRKSDILIIDDEENILSSLKRALSIEGFNVDVAGNATIGLEKIKKNFYDLILLDVQLPDMSGIDLLKEIQKFDEPIVTIMMSGHATTETAVKATKLGAYTFLEKPVSLDQLLVNIKNALKFKELENEISELKDTHVNFIGESKKVLELKEMIKQVAQTQATVLIRGERGTGKEIVAAAIHGQSQRNHKVIEKLNCAAVPAELIESELFGHEVGSFTGAHQLKRGRFERANGGSLFLDEVGDMPLAMQAKLLRVLQEGEFERVGGTKTIKVDVRIIAASNKDFELEIQEGNFRADLFDRLNVIPLSIPPLRQRLDDIPLISPFLVEKISKINGIPKKEITKEAYQILQTYHYPGNIRELRNLLERIMILSKDKKITKETVQQFLPKTSKKDKSYYQQGRKLKEMVDEAEKDIIEEALKEHDSHITKTAESLQIERSNLYKKMKQLGIQK